MFFYFDVNFKISHRKNRYFIWMSFYLNEFNYSNSVEKTENNEKKNPKKTEKKTKSVGDLYDGGVLLF